MPTLAVNKQANFNYEILEKFEAGLSLLGHEVKSAKAGQINLKGAYISFKDGQFVLVNAHIAPYLYAGPLPSYDPYRQRALLLNKKEIRRLIGKTQETGLTLIPLKVYTKARWIKLEFSLAKGKKKHDKREDIKKKDVDKEIRQRLKSAR